MKLLLGMLVVVLGLSGATRTASQTGPWNDTATWGGLSIPGSGDNVIIGSFVVNVPNGYTATAGTKAPATPCCTRPTVALTGVGATNLSTGNHYVYYTVVDANGESGFSPESAVIAVTNGGTPPRVTFSGGAPAVGQTYNLYSAPTSGGERLYASGISAATYDMLIAEPMVTAHPGLGNSGIRINGTAGSLVVDDGGTLIVQGDIGLNNATLTLTGGSTFQWDTTQSLITTAPYVTWIAVASNQTNSKIAVTGTSNSSWVEINSVVGGANGRFDLPLASSSVGQRYSNPGPINLSYVEIERCGDATYQCMAYMGNDATLSHVTCDSCGKLVYGLFDLNTVPTRSWIFDYVGTYNTVDPTYSFYMSLSANSTIPSGTRRILGSSFDKKVWMPQNALAVSDTYFGEGWTAAGVSSGKTWASFTNNFVRKVVAGELLSYGDATDSYWMTDEQIVGNAHYVAPDPGLTTVTYSRNLFEYTGPSTSSNDVGDAMLHFDRSGMTVTIDHNIVLPNTSYTDSSGMLVTLFTSNTLLAGITIDHNTGVMGTTFGMLAINEPSTGTNMAQNVITFTNNIAWKPSTILTGSRYKVADIRNFSSLSSAPGNFLLTGNYNSGCNLQASSAEAVGTTAGGYWVKSSFQLGANDVDFANCEGGSSPGFLDGARNFSKWARSLGAVGTDAQVRDIGLYNLLHRNDRTGAVAGYTISASVAYVTAGFAPTSAALKGTGSGGSDIGAVAVTANYDIGPGRTYTNLGDAPWSSMVAGDTVTIYPKTPILLTSAGASTGTTTTFATSTASIPYGSSVWVQGTSTTTFKTWVTCGEYGSGIYGSTVGGTPCGSNQVTTNDSLTVALGDVVWFTPPYYEKLVITTEGTITDPFLIQSIPDPTSGALPIFDAHNASTGPNMTHFGSTSQHDRLGLFLTARTPDQLHWATYVTVRGLRLQGTRPGLVFWDESNVLTAYNTAGGIAGFRIQSSNNFTLDQMEFVDNENGTFSKTDNGAIPPSNPTDIAITGNTYYWNGLSSGNHQSYTEVNRIVFENNYFGRTLPAASCSQLKDRSAGTVIRYNYFLPAGRVLDLVNAQDGFTQLIPYTRMTVPAGGFTAGQTSLTFTAGSLATVNIGDYIGWINTTQGWGYDPFTISTNKTMPAILTVDTGTLTITLATGIPTSVAAGEFLYLFSKTPVNQYLQTFVYGNVFDYNQGYYLRQPGAMIHYGWDTQGGIDSVKDRAGTLYYYNNTHILQWDKNTTTGWSFFMPVFQLESNFDNISLVNNLFYMKNWTGSPSDIQLMARSGYNGLRMVGVTTTSGNLINSDGTGKGSTTCNSITTFGWAACDATYPLAGTISVTGMTNQTQAQLYPLGVGIPGFELQAGSTAIGAAVALPAAALELDLTPVYQFAFPANKVARSTVVDVGAYEYLTGITITSVSPLVAGTTGAAYSVTLTSVGGSGGNVWSISSGSLPTGLALNSGTGAITGTPSVDGVYNFTVGLVDSALNSTSKPLSITITNPPVDISSSSPLTSGYAGIGYSNTLVAIGGDGTYTWTLFSGSLPTGLTLQTNGTIIGTPVSLGVSNFVVRVVDGDMISATKPMQITIEDPGTQVIRIFGHQVMSGGVVKIGN